MFTHKKTAVDGGPPFASFWPERTRSTTAGSKLSVTDHRSKARWALAHQNQGRSLDQVQARRKLKGRATSPILVGLRLLCRMLTRRVCLMH